ncbi:MAG: hypothetical protein ACREPQ_14145 [Rhodanobacter sp.]
MLTLESNGIGGSSTTGGTGKWYGTDATTIHYPGVDTCVTVTCVVKEGLAGLHLAASCFAATTAENLATYGENAKGASAMHVVGNLARGWSATPEIKNLTKMVYLPEGGGTLIARLRQATGFQGVVQVIDTSDRGDAVDITATLAGETVNFHVSGSDPTPSLLPPGKFVAGDVILP